MEEILVALFGQLGSEQIAQSESELNRLHNENPVVFMSSIINILRNESISPKLKVNACVIAGRYFPDDVSKLPEQEELHPFNVYTDQVVSELIELCFVLITTMDPQYRHYLAVLLGKIGSLYVHRNFENSILNRLSDLLQQAQFAHDMSPVCQAINIILIGYDPSDEEIEKLIYNVLEKFEESKDLAQSIVVLDTIIAMIESIDSLFNSPEIPDAVASVLIALLEKEASVKASLTCWNRLAELTPSFVATLSEPLVTLTCSALESSQDPDTLMQGCMLINAIATLELNDREWQMETISQLSELIVASLVNIMSKIDTPECITPDQWTPPIAAFKAIKSVISVNCDNIIPILENFINGGIGSENFADVDVALKLLSMTICNTTDVTFSLKYLDALTELVSNEAPCIRQRALHCIRKGLETLTKSQNFQTDAAFKASVLDLVNKATEFAQLIGDEQIFVASEAAQLMQVLCNVAEFQHTEEILQTIIEFAVSISENFYKNPFDVLNDIIQYGNAEACAKFFADLVNLYVQAISSEGSLWHAHELAETIQVYCYRKEYANLILQHSEELISKLVEALQAGGDVAKDALLPLAAVARAIGPQNFGNYLADTVQLYLQIFEISPAEQDPDTLYNATFALDMLIKSDFAIGDISRFITVMIAYLQNFDTLPNNRFAFLNLLATIAEKSFGDIAAGLETIMPQIKIFATTLNVEAHNDQGEAEIIATYLARIMSTTYKNIPPDQAAGLFDIGADIVVYFSNFPPLFKPSRDEVLKLVVAMATINPQAVQEIIESDPEGGIINLFADALSHDNAEGVAAQLLDKLNFK